MFVGSNINKTSMTNNFPEILTTEKINERQVDFRNSLFGLDKKSINADDSKYLTNIYSSTK
jgi:hypothetical protein